MKQILNSFHLDTQYVYILALQQMSITTELGL